MMEAFRNLEGETKLLADTIEEICEEYDHDYWLEYAKEGDNPEELWQELSAAGYSGINVPEEYGGVDMDLYDTAVTLERMTSKGVMAGFLVISSAMAPIPILNSDNEQLKERFLPEIATGETKFCFGITEPESGTNSYKMTTSATREGDEYVVNGQKFWVSDIDEADYLLLVLRTTPYEEVKDEKRYDGITLLVVPTDAAGIELSQIDTAITSASSAFSVQFNDVRVPVENRIGEEGDGFSYLFDALNPERVAVASECVGFGRFAIDRAVSYVNDREVWDAPLGSHQGVQHQLSRAKVQVELAGLATERAAKAFDAGNPNAGEMADMAKYAASEAAHLAVQNSIQVHGGAGFMRDYGVVNVRDFIQHARVAPVNNEMMLNGIAERILGLPKSY